MYLPCIWLCVKHGYGSVPTMYMVVCCHGYGSVPAMDMVVCCHGYRSVPAMDMVVCCHGYGSVPAMDMIVYPPSIWLSQLSLTINNTPLKSTTPESWTINFVILFNNLIYGLLANLS